MKITVETKLSDSQYAVVLNDNASVKQSIIDCKDKDGPFIHGAIVTQSGIVTGVNHDYANCQPDIATITFRTNRDNPLPFSFPLFEAMLYADGTHSNPIGINWSSDMTDADFEYFMSVIKSWFVANKYYVTKQHVWLKSKPWINIKPGMGCDEAVKILTKLGW